MRSGLSVALAKAAWTGRRLSAMSGPEIVHRVGDQLRRRCSRFDQRDWVAAAPVGTPLPVLPGLREGLTAMPTPAALREQWREVAERARAGRLLLLGREWPGVQGPDKWHLDPISGRPWPSRRYCHAIDHRHASEHGDIKYVWEINRLQHLQPIAALAMVEHDSALAKFCADEIESWIDATPPFLGVSWKTGIETALRAVSLVVVTTLIGEQSFEKSQRLKLWGTLAAHAAWLARF